MTKYLPGGFVNDGSKDYTEYIQKALDENLNVIFPDFPLLINDKGLSFKSGSVVKFQRGSKLVLKPSRKSTYYMVKIHDKRNVILINPVLEGDRKRHLGKGGEWGMGIDIRGSEGIKILNPIVRNCWGDGIYIGQMSGKPSKGVEIVNAFLDYNRRNGLSITSGSQISIKSPVISNTNGTLPMCGIDIEPNNNQDLIDDILIENAYTFNNTNSGLIIGLGKLIGPLNKQVNINIRNHIDEGSDIGFYFGGILPIDRKKGKSLQGTINVENPSWNNNVSRPILTRRGFGRAPHLRISNPKTKHSNVKYSVKEIKRNYTNNSNIEVF
ncbi:hypothetical protein GFH32_17190 [Sphingobacteruim zhuxiongii]|uniref:Right handed beta helix domain-containing protein n=1 Tax=Sphingobacterium zhuxiongii TaxID=2662364 RepID=A0A5Q0QEF1_9SPHI|nr:hypothetical protein GFH32_17190 [Sphingobacterium sp. dk4302]